MSFEQTLVGSEQSVKKSRIAKVHFILKKVKIQLKFKSKKCVIEEEGVLY